MKTLTISLLVCCILVAVSSKPSTYYYNKHMWVPGGVDELSHPKSSLMREWQNTINNQIEDKIVQNKINKKIEENIVRNEIDDKTEDDIIPSEVKIPPIRENLMSKLESIATKSGTRLRRAVEESEEIQETEDSFVIIVSG